MSDLTLSAKTLFSGIKNQEDLNAFRILRDYAETEFMEAQERYLSAREAVNRLGFDDEAEVSS